MTITSELRHQKSCKYPSGKYCMIIFRRDICPGAMFGRFYVRVVAARGSMDGSCDSFVSLVEAVSDCSERLAGRWSRLIGTHLKVPRVTFGYCRRLSDVISVTFDMWHDGNMTANYHPRLVFFFFLLLPSFFLLYFSPFSCYSADLVAEHTVFSPTIVAKLETNLYKYTNNTT